MTFKAVYLLAGVGSRLRPLTDKLPKSLIKVNGKAFLARSIESMVSNGIENFVIVTGYKADLIQSFFKENYPNLNITFINNDVYASTNNSYSLHLAQKAFSGEEGMYLLDGDILFDSKIVSKLKETPDDVNLLATRKSNDLGDEEMKVILKNENDVLSIEKKLDIARSYGESIGIAKFSPSFVQELFKTLHRRMDILGIVNEFYEASFQELIDKGERVSIMNTGDLKCMEVDTLEDLEEAKRTIIPFIDGK